MLSSFFTQHIPMEAYSSEIQLDKHDLIYSSASSSVKYPSHLSISATYDEKEGIVFTIRDVSRLTVQRISFSLTQLHQVVTVNSKEGRLAMENCFVRMESGTTTPISPICTSIAALSAPLVLYTPKPSDDDELGSGSLLSARFIGIFPGHIVLSDTRLRPYPRNNLNDLNLVSLFNVHLSLSHQRRYNVSDQLSKELKQKWNDNLQAAALVTSLLGEDISMDLSDKWRTGSLVYWLVSPSGSIRIGSDENAVDHPNCGSSTFMCTTLDSAFRSAGLNKISTLTLSTSTSLSSTLRATSSLLIQSSSATKQGIELDETGSIEVTNSTTKLSFTLIFFTVAETCVSDTLFMVEEGELSFSSCQFGGTNSESALVFPASTTTLIRVKADGTLTLTDTLIQHVVFSHATLGTALCLHLGATVSSSGTKPISAISSKAVGSHVLVDVSTNSDANSLSTLSSYLQGWGPTLTNSPRFSKAEINEFGVIDENEQVDELIYSWYPDDGTTMHLHSEGGSHAKCGVSTLPCSSLSGKVEVVGDGEAIVICSPLTETAGFVATKDLSIHSSDNTKQIISVSSSTSFATQDSSLSFSHLAFVPLPSSSSHNSEPLQRVDSLFVVESGSIELSDCSLSSFVLANKPLITHTSGSLSLEWCEISSITRSTGNGTILETTMETGISLSLNDVTFSSMTSSRESALLALSFPLFDESEPVPFFNFNLTNLHFVEMSENEDEQSCFVSIVGPKLADWICEDDARFDGSYSKTTPLTHFWTFDSLLDLSATLLFYLLPLEGPVGVSSSGFDMAKCGSHYLWCSTIQRSITRLSAQKTNKIVVMDEIALSTSISLPDGVIFTGNNANTLCTCQVGESGSFETADENVMSITTLDFSLPSEHRMFWRRDGNEDE
ncbi:hypothetical protein BLNAU_19063 [Blattamonas nauphoetae]|uniref:Uncharacterized protein n=1 Tax=Blattamonas nauphoetae TaxID=2049346 RepID=A0ABQ9X4Y1_9EUKA|nr:hypothetical protein BLNAU_19063 [Blattamonas nauphoetae]